MQPLCFYDSFYGAFVFFLMHNSSFPCSFVVAWKRATSTLFKCAPWKTGHTGKSYRAGMTWGWLFGWSITSTTFKTTDFEHICMFVYVALCLNPLCWVCLAACVCVCCSSMPVNYCGIVWACVCVSFSQVFPSSMVLPAPTVLMAFTPVKVSFLHTFSQWAVQHPYLWSLFSISHLHFPFHPQAR